MSVTRDDPTLAKQGLATLLRAADDATADVRTAALHGLRRLGEVGVLCTHLRAEVPALLTRLAASLAVYAAAVRLLWGAVDAALRLVRSSPRLQVPQCCSILPLH
jgi:hypothetical protein